MTHRATNYSIALALLAASTVAGCAQTDGNFSNGSALPAEAEEVTLAILTNDGSVDCIELIDVANDIGRTIVLDADIIQPRDFARQNQGDFIVAGADGYLWRVDAEGQASLFTEETVVGLEGIQALKDGQVLTFSRDGVELFNAGGQSLTSIPHQEGGRWSDAAEVWGGELVLVDAGLEEAYTWGEDGSLTLRFLLPEGSMASGADEDGRFYVGGDSGALTIAQESDAIPQEMDGFVSGTVSDIVSANDHGVYVMTTGMGSARGNLDAQSDRIFYATNEGDIAEVMRSTTQKWLDFLVVP